MRRKPADCERWTAACRRVSPCRAGFGTLVASVLCCQMLAAGELRFRTQEIATDLTIGYAVSLCDVNHDGRTDIVVVDKARVIWYENPSWRVRTILQGTTALDNVCLAPHDIDGDGRLDFALGAGWQPANTHSGGTIQWLRRGKTLDEPWEWRLISEDEPTTHRIRWADVDGDSRLELVVAPLFGRDAKAPQYAEQGVRIFAYRVPADPVRDRWQPLELNQTLHVTHNLWPTDLDRDGRTDILITAFEGVFSLVPTAGGAWNARRIGEGNQQTSPNRGASEVKLGQLANRRDYVATIEPWHGHQVVVYTRPESDAQELWTRQVLDEDLKWGHAVWCVNLDDDEDQELVIGVRDDKSETVRSGVRIFDPQTEGNRLTWQRQLLDPGGVAVEDLSAADLNGDGRQDIVAVGRKTGNLRIYWNEGR